MTQLTLHSLILPGSAKYEPAQPIESAYLDVSWGFCKFLYLAMIHEVMDLFKNYLELEPTYV